MNNTHASWFPSCSFVSLVVYGLSYRERKESVQFTWIFSAGSRRAFTREFPKPSGRLGGLATRSESPVFMRLAPPFSFLLRR
jgi:hypothetical protein